MKEVGLIIDLDQIQFSDKDFVNKAVSGFYNPLLKLLKSNQEISVSLKISLGTLELLDRFGHQEVISTLKDLYLNYRVEVVDTTPYGVGLDIIPKELVEANIILNEYGLGYYLGFRQGFEGEPSIMLRDITGFISPSGNLDTYCLESLSGLGYKWAGIRDVECTNYCSALGSGGSDLQLVSYLDYSSRYLADSKSEEVYTGVSESGGDTNEIKEMVQNFLISDSSQILVLFGNFYGSVLNSYNRDYWFSDLINNLIQLIEIQKEGKIKIKTVEDINKTLRKVAGKDFVASVKETNISKDVVGVGSMNINVKHLSSILSLISSRFNGSTFNDSLSPLNMWSYDISSKNINNNFHLYTNLYIIINKIISFSIIINELNPIYMTQSLGYITEVLNSELENMSNISELIKDEDIGNSVKAEVSKFLSSVN